MAFLIYGRREEEIRCQPCKIRSAAHQEYNKRRVLWNVGKAIREHSDILGRDADFQIVPIDDSYPEYIRTHLKEYKHLVYPKHRPGFMR